MFGRSKLVADRREEPQVPAAQTVPPPVAPLLGVVEAQVKPSIISDAVCFVGELVSKGAIHIDGSAKGTVEAETVTVGTTGSFDGRVSCRKLHVKGRFSGSAVCDDLVISDEASVNASLTYRTMLVQRGAQIDGELYIIEETRP